MKDRSTLLLLLALALSGCSPLPPPAEGFRVADGLELTLWAAEPDLVNPTNIDIDERGRVWALESVNYRAQLKGREDLVPEGDRIVILEDVDGDGRADSRKVFDQRPELRAPLGIAVLGDKVYVSQSPDLIVYTKDADDNIVDRQVLLTGWGGYDHDHGIHAITFGFDGRLYFNSGDQGFDVVLPSGRRFVSSREGPYFAGAALRINPDGSDFTVLAHNFRNPFELAQDSFGTIWQTDNDDDGNRWTRLNYVMEGGNFGYWGPGGRRWREDRGTHFHHELPGVVPDIARTGPGSPAGLLIYEGNLLPEKYRGALIHAEPGKRNIFGFFLVPDGAGYSMTDEKIVSADSPDFRPSDVVAAPDGSIFIADWHDPVVGGHNMMDVEKGRIYRLAPPRSAPMVSELDLESGVGLAAALGSPNQARRYLAYQALRAQGDAAIPTLQSMREGEDPTLRARAMWLLAQTSAGGDALEDAFHSTDPRFRILAMRIARFSGEEPVTLAERFAEDPDPAVRREAALALQYVSGSRTIAPLLALARGYDGEDRWYLEAWTIGARGKEEALYDALVEEFPRDWDPKLAQFLWQLKPRRALPYLSRALKNPKLSTEDRSLALRAIGDRAERASARIVAQTVSSPNAMLADRAFDKVSRQLFSEWTPYREDPLIRNAVRRALDRESTQHAAIELVDALEDDAYAPQVLSITRSGAAPVESRAAAIETLGRFSDARYVAILATMSENGDTALRQAAVRGLGAARPGDLDDRMAALILSDGPNEVRSEALRVLGRTAPGMNRILDLEATQELPAELRSLATSMAHASRDEKIQARAAELLPVLAGRDEKKLPSLRSLERSDGDVERGRAVFEAKDGPKCVNCHSLEEGIEKAGPNLASIGLKYDRAGLLDSLINPSAGIAPEYYVWILETKSHGLVTGVLAEDTGSADSRAQRARRRDSAHARRGDGASAQQSVDDA